ncbi:amino acid/polyamine transporter I [Bisporella sp. PMI_857]|nr:amino acid/polyamine transporter I [Bisporella sp. PMI_857]
MSSPDRKVDPRDPQRHHTIIDDDEFGDAGSDALFHTTESRRNIGVTSAIFLILNRMVGTGIFATPSGIFKLTGSAGLSLFLWLVGTLIAAAGMAVFLEFGTALPRNGGEKNYLEFVYRKPKFLVTGLYTGYAILLGWAGSNSVVFGEYILHAADVEVTRWNMRGVGLACITSAFLIHATAVKWGLRLQNLLGSIKIFILLFIICSGFAALGGHLKIPEGEPRPKNFTNAFAGTTGSAYGVIMAIYNIIWSFIGYSNANYAMSEMKNPVRTLKIAGPSAVFLVGVLYMLANIAYFAAVPREEILNSGRILAATFFRNVYGAKAEKAMSVFVALSAYGNVLSVIFSQGRIVQELGREGILPFSKLWASNKPFNAPAAGLFEHYIVAVIIMLAPPPGDAYNFILNLIAYPLSVINVFVALGLLYLYYLQHHPTTDPALAPLNKWNPPFRAGWFVAGFFLLSNLYLVIAPYIPPPTADDNVYASLPYWIHCVVTWGIFGVGGVYWVFWAKLLPWWGGYRLEKHVEQEDGVEWPRNRFIKVKNT